MPIDVRTDLRAMTEDVFKEVAFAVTGEVFDIHNRFGNLFNERVYKYELARKCRCLGFPQIDVEVPVEVTFESFRKEYFLDLLVCGGALFELKAEAALVPAHQSQTLNYLFLTGLQRAKLFNFGAIRVQHEFVSTTLTLDGRRRFVINDRHLRAIDSDSHRFRELFVAILSDWGCFLSLSLYREAIAHFFGGTEQVIRQLPVMADGQLLTTQPTHTLNDRTAFKLTATSETDIMEVALRRFLQHTQLTAIQWVNLRNHDVTFVTLLNGD